MLSLPLILTILVAHFIADFIMQSDSMAKGKSTSNYWLSLHVAGYTGTLVTLLGIFFTLSSSYPLFTNFVLWAALNGLAHFITDYFTSRWTSSLWKQGRTHDFFVVVGLDQLLHYLVLFTTAKWLLQG